MPTPSSNPPPALPPRSHGSACPEEWRASATTSSPWQTAEAVHSDDSDEQETISNTGSPHPAGGSGGEGTIMSPGPSESHQVTMVDEDMDSRSNTESPRPDSRSGGFSTAQTTPAPPEHRHQHDLGSGALTSSSTKIADDEDIEETTEDGPASRSRRSGRGQVLNAQTSASAATTPFEGMTPSTATEGDKTIEAGNSATSSKIQHEYCEPPMGYNFSNRRVSSMSYSSFLRPGSKFHGTQQSERQIYDVQVEIKNVNFEASSMCGYLKIQGLTEDNPTLTTYFEGEIIGSKYNFITNHHNWGASEKIDLNHWNKFTAFRPYAKSARKGPVHIPDLHNKENIFMRWKEHFLVPDHRVRTINGASFEGFYYICFNQKLELKHVENRGCFGAMEFR